MSRVTIILATVAAAALVVTGCGRKASHTVIATPNGTVTTSEGSGGTVNYNVKGANGQQAHVQVGPGATAKLPAFLPLYPGAEVQGSVTGGGAEGSGGMVTLQTSAKPADVIAFYKQKTAAGGFGETYSSQTGDSITFGAGKNADQSSFSITATAAPGSPTLVQLVWSDKKPG